jgi:hypothetical protein
MKHSIAVRSVGLLVLLAATILWPARLAEAQDVNDAIGAVRTTYAVDRQVFLAEHLQLTGSESAAFWPLYRQYRAKQEQVGDGLVKLVLEYGDAYPNVPEDRARQLLKDYAALETKLANTRAEYLKKFEKILPAAKTLRFAQLENRLDLALRLQLASAIPLAPIEGRLRGEATAATAMAQGVPGGAAVATYQITATVTAIEKDARKVTLLGQDNIKQTVKVGLDAINFDQIRVGDQVTLTLIEQLIISVVGEGGASSDAGAQVVALAPTGAKPGGVLAETTQVTAKVTAIDSEHRRATLQFEDGSIHTVAVRPDIDLAKRKVGDKVVIRLTEAVAIGVKTPKSE